MDSHGTKCSDAKPPPITVHPAARYMGIGPSSLESLTVKIEKRTLRQTGSRRCVLIVLTAVLVVVGLCHLSQDAPEVFRATAIVSLSSPLPHPIGHDYVENAVSGKVVSQANSRSQYDSVVGEAVSIVVDELALNLPPDENGRRKGSARSAEAERVLLSQVTVQHIPGSEIVALHVDNPDPHRARKLVGHLAKAYLALERQRGVDKEGAGLAAGQHRCTWEGLTTRKRNTRDHGRPDDTRLAAAGKPYNIADAEIGPLVAKLTEVRSRKTEMEARRADMIGRGIREHPTAIADAEVDPNGLIQSLRQVHDDLVVELDGLSEQYGPKHPRFVAVAARRDSVREDIEREVRNVVNAIDTGIVEAMAAEQGLLKEIARLKRQEHKSSETAIAYDASGAAQKTEEASAPIEVAQMAGVSVPRFRVLGAFPLKTTRRAELSVWAVVLIAGLLLVGLLAPFVRGRSNTMNTKGELKRLGLSSLGIVPLFDTSQGIYVDTHPESLTSALFRSIYRGIRFKSIDHPVKRILVTSPTSGDGKTTVAMNLAATIAKTGAKVIIVEADMRYPSIHRIFRQWPQKGLSTIALDEDGVQDSVVGTRLANLDILMCGPTPRIPPELILRGRLETILGELESQYDYIILDSPPLFPAVDASIVARIADGTVVVAMKGNSLKNRLKHTARTLRETNALILGVVVNGVDVNCGDYFSKDGGPSDAFSDERNAALSDSEQMAQSV